METLAKATGLTLGLALAAVLVLSWRVPADGAVAPASVSLAPRPAGELELRPAGALPTATLAAGGRPAFRQLRLRNITPLPLDVRVRLVAPSLALDRALRVRFAADDGQPLAAGSLGQLRRWSRGSVRVAPGRTAVLAVSLAIPEGPYAAEAGGADVDLTAEFRSRPVEARP